MGKKFQIFAFQSKSRLLILSCLNKGFRVTHTIHLIKIFYKDQGCNSQKQISLRSKLKTNIKELIPLNHINQKINCKKGKILMIKAIYLLSIKIIEKY